MSDGRPHLVLGDEKAADTVPASAGIDSPDPDAGSFSDDPYYKRIRSYVLDQAETKLEQQSGLSSERYLEAAYQLLHEHWIAVRSAYIEREDEDKKAAEVRRRPLWPYGSLKRITLFGILLAPPAVALSLLITGIGPRIVPFVIFGLGFFASAYLLFAASRYRGWSFEHRVARDRLDSLILRVVTEPALARAAEVVWTSSSADHVRVTGIAELTAKASARNLITTSASTQVAVALSRRYGSAIGLAGPRGAGKTELARSFTTHLKKQESSRSSRATSPSGSEAGSRTVPVMLWAPVNYDPGTFLLRLLKELCRSILGAREVAAADDSLRPLPRSSLVKGMAIVWLLIALLGIGVTLLILSLSNRKVEPDLQLGLAALLLFVFVTALLTVTLSSLVRERRFVRPYPLSFSSSGVPPWTRDYARRLKQQVEFSETYKSNSQLSFAAYGVGASGSRGNERARVPLNEIDAVKEIEALVQELAQEDFQVVIAIDELDKMKTDEDALAFLNQLKVLFPIENCSFIVSVSEHAWARFEHRGLPFRDAFDSSFDEVVLVPPLRPNESRDLLKRRNAEITDVQALFCHCLSGGLPRDLLRAARSLAETAETVMKTPPTSEPPSFSTVLNELLLSDLRDKVAAAEVRARDLDPPKLDLRELNCWIEIWPDESSLLDNLVQSRSDSLLEGTAVNDADRIPNADEVMVEQRLRSLREELAVYVGVLFTIREAFAPRGPLCKLVGQHDYAGDLIDDGFDGVARARLRISLDTIDGWRVLNSARSVLGLRPIESTARNVTRGGGQAS